jgi:hypothetical protein
MEIELSYMPAPRASTAWLVEGTGKQPKVCIGSPDCPPSVFLDILRRDVETQGYTTARQIAFGGIAIEPAMQKGDQTYTAVGGHYPFIGRRPIARTEATSIGTSATPLQTSVWRVKTPAGAMIFVAPHEGAKTPLDVRQVDPSVVLEMLTRVLEGPCTIERVDSAQLTVTDSIVPPDMNLVMLEKAGEPS